MRDSDIHRIMGILQKEALHFETPMMVQIGEEDSKSNQPFRVLVSTVLSSRTKDKITREASKRLFQLAQTPKAIVMTPVEKIEAAIHPVGFWKIKAKNLVRLCQILLEEYNSEVPNSLGELLKLPGVGSKTANLVLGVAFNIPAICVDTHVHRISNRLGYVTTKTPRETERVLRRKLPKEHWIGVNETMVRWGQNVCTPISPYCSKCPLFAASKLCDRVGVTKSR